MKNFLRKILLLFVLGVLSQPCVENTCSGMRVYEAKQAKTTNIFELSAHGLYTGRAFKSVEDWNKVSFKEALLEIFPYIAPLYAFGHTKFSERYKIIYDTIISKFGNITNFVEEIEKQRELAVAHHCDHIAIARVIVHLNSPNLCYVYPIPYLFVSGNTLSNTKKYGFKEMIKHTRIENPNIIFKVIDDFGINSFNGDQNFNHSERAIGLCLLYDDVFNIENFLSFHDLKNIDAITVQIKTIYEMCTSCRDFWEGTAYTTFIPAGDTNSMKFSSETLTEKQKACNYKKPEEFKIVKLLQDKIKSRGCSAKLNVLFSKQEDVFAIGD